MPLVRLFNRVGPGSFQQLSIVPFDRVPVANDYVKPDGNTLWLVRSVVLLNPAAATGAGPAVADVFLERDIDNRPQ